MRIQLIGSRATLKEELAKTPAFREHWMHSALAGAVAIALIRYRAEHGLSQRGLAKLLGISQPRVSRLELGERHPTPEALACLTRQLGLRISLEVAPSQEPEGKIAVQPCKDGEILTLDGVSITSTRRSRPGARTYPLRPAMTGASYPSISRVSTPTGPVSRRCSAT